VSQRRDESNISDSDQKRRKYRRNKNRDEKYSQEQ